MTRKWVLLAPLVILGILLFVALGGTVVLLLWNWLLPPLFGWPQITFWQGLGLLALCRILFGGFGGHGFWPSHARYRMGERWAHMTPEERDRLRHGMRGLCGFGSSTSEGGQ